eukprot:2499533-Amphidinium_carterae.1
MTACLLKALEEGIPFGEDAELLEDSLVGLQEPSQDSPGVPNWEIEDAVAHRGPHPRERKHRSVTSRAPLANEDDTHVRSLCLGANSSSMPDLSP